MMESIEIPEKIRHLYEGKSAIVKFPKPILRAQAKQVTSFNPGLYQRATEMITTMRSNHGIGLAANQVGWDKRVMVVGSEKPTIYVNPEILHTEGSELGQEACLSLPRLVGKVERAKTIVAKVFDLRGRSETIELTGLEAIIFQHEIDHLDGVLFIDKVVDGTMRWNID